MFVDIEYLCNVVLVANSINVFRRIYTKIKLQVERNAFVLDHQHGRRDVTCKPAIDE